jgi:hypothetical protein
LIDEQNSIGWYGLLRGFASKEWAKHQHTHLYHNDKVTITSTGSLWLTSLLVIIWDQTFLLWKLYKDTLHGVDAKAQTAILRRHLHKKIRALHDRRPEVRAEDRRWFIPDLDHYFAHARTATMQAWLSTYQPILLDAIRLGRVAALVNTRSLRHYFPTTAAPRNPRDLAATLTPRLHVPGNDARARAHRRALFPRPEPTVQPTVMTFFRPTALARPTATPPGQ